MVISAVYFAAYLREQIDPSLFITSDYMFIYALVMAGMVWLGLLSVGLYRSRQQARLFSTLLRVTTALVLGTSAAGLLFFVIRARFTPI